MMDNCEAFSPTEPKLEISTNKDKQDNFYLNTPQNRLL